MRLIDPVRLLRLFHLVGGMLSLPFFALLGIAVLHNAIVIGIAWHGCSLAVARIR
jgi:hypothetical protein